MSEHQESRSQRRSFLPGGTFDERLLPPQARLVRGATDPGIWAAAVNMHYAMIDPDTMKPWHGQELAPGAAATFQRATADCHTWAAERSEEPEGRAHDLAESARGHAGEAVDRIENIGTVLDDLYQGPSGALITGQTLLAEHQAAQELAAAREHDGDTRHQEHRFEHAWVVLAVGVFALLDMILLWRPLLGLGFRQDAGMLIKWCVGLGMATGQALFIESAIRLYQKAERVCRDRRDARTDYNRTVRTAGPSALAVAPPPELEAVRAADDRLLTVERLVALAAAFTGVICAARVAILGRQTALSMIEATLFAAIVGLVLGGLVLLLAWLSRRGNQLGDRLVRGAAAVALLEGKLQEAREAIAECRERAWADLTASEAASTAARATQEAVAGDYWAAMLLACSWVGYDSTLVPRPDLSGYRSPLADLTDELRRSVETRLTAIDEWLARRLNVRAATPVTPALVAGHFPAALPASAAPPPPGTVVVRRPEIELLPEPKSAHRLLLAGAVLTVGVAAAAGVLAPTQGSAPGSLSAPHPYHVELTDR
jgi:hypothetical protein